MIRGVVLFFRAFLNLYVVFISYLHLPNEDKLSQMERLKDVRERRAEFEEIELEDVAANYKRG